MLRFFLFYLPVCICLFVIVGTRHSMRREADKYETTTTTKTTTTSVARANRVCEQVSCWDDVRSDDKKTNALNAAGLRVM